MEEYQITTHSQILDHEGFGPESDWTLFGQIEIKSGNISVSDPMLFPDGPPTFPISAGLYAVCVKTMVYTEGTRVSRFRCLRGNDATLGTVLDEVGVDFGQVGMFDPVALHDSCADLSDEDGDEIVNQLNALELVGLVRYGNVRPSWMAVVSAGFGDGGYPIYDLTWGGCRVGLEVAFIEPAHMAKEP